MTEHLVTSYEIGEKVYCKAFGHWYEGTIVKFGRTKIHVEFTTGSGKTRIRPCSLDEISKEKLQGRMPRRSKYIEIVDDPEMVEQEIMLSQMDRTRLMAAFVVLSLPAGTYRGTTHTRARELIEELIHIKLKKSARPESGKGRDLQQYVTWASDPDRQLPILEDE